MKIIGEWRVFFFSLTMMKFREIAEERPASLARFSCTAKKKKTQKKRESVLNSVRCRQVKRQRRSDTCLFVQPFLNHNTEVLSLDFVCHVAVSLPQVRQWCRWQPQMLMTPPTETAPGWCTVYCKGSRTSLWNLRQVRLSLHRHRINTATENMWTALVKTTKDVTDARKGSKQTLKARLCSTSNTHSDTDWKLQSVPCLHYMCISGQSTSVLPETMRAVLSSVSSQQTGTMRTSW